MMLMVIVIIIIININFISTESALRLPTTYDNHPIPSHPTVQHIALNHLNRPKIDLSRPPMTSNDLQ